MSMRAPILLVLIAGILPAEPPDPPPNTSGGPLIPEQAAYDVLHYDLALRIDPAKKAIAGTLTVRARATAALEVLVLDLDAPLQVSAVRDGADAVTAERDGLRIRMKLARPRAAGEEFTVAVDYAGMPRVASNPPWNGGFTWSETRSGEPWIATSCQGEGADLWWPCKDHPSDEPEGMDLHFTVPAPLVAASNGKLVKTEKSAGGTRTFHWKVSTPINNYGVALCVAPYRTLESKFRSAGGQECPVVFYVLPENERKAQKLLPEIVDHVLWFEELFGPYPFRGDKYGVAETPFLGMEHQSLIAYGYRYQKDRWGYDWLHHHELSHEWWGNLVSCPDWNDFWIHEGIGTYSQVLYVEKLKGEKAMRQEVAKHRRVLGNRRPVAPRESRTTTQMYFGDDGGPKDNDIYFKGACFLHTLRFVIGKEALLKALRRMCYPDPALEKSTDGKACHFATTEDLLRLVDEISQKKLGWMFEVYLRQPALPKLHHEISAGVLHLRWESPGNLPFPMPVEIEVGGQRRRIELPDGRAEVKLGSASSAEVDPDQWLLRAF